TLLPDGRVLVAGGYDRNHQRLASAEIYDPSSGRWAPTSPMLAARLGHTATLLPSGQVLVAGGFLGGNGLLSAELYNPSLGTWFRTGPMVALRLWHSASLLASGRLLVAGGESSEFLASAEVFDPIGSQRAMPFMPASQWPKSPSFQRFTG